VARIVRRDKLGHPTLKRIDAIAVIVEEDGIIYQAWPCPVGWRVIALDGDGADLMNLGSLATIADQEPENYLLVILDKGCYSPTGCQPTCTCRMADGAGVTEVRVSTTPEEIRKGMTGNGVLMVKVEIGNANVPMIDLTLKEIIDRFMEEPAQTSSRS